jgi:carboxymethylenebutenolidase
VGAPAGGLAVYARLTRRKLVDRNGREMPGQLDDSAGASKRSVVVMHDFFGLTRRTTAVVRSLAAEGFITFAPDLYRGRVAGTPDEAAALAQSLAWNRVAEELGLVVEALVDRSEGGRVAIVGHAMGGAAALVAAAAIGKLSAAVTFYGIPQDVVIENPRIKILGHFAARDQKCTPARVEALERDLSARGVPHELHSYAADNGFADPGREAFAPDDAAMAWQRTLCFLGAALDAR